MKREDAIGLFIVFAVLSAVLFALGINNAIQARHALAAARDSLRQEHVARIAAEGEASVPRISRAYGLPVIIGDTVLHYGIVPDSSFLTLADGHSISVGRDGILRVVR